MRTAALIVAAFFVGLLFGLFASGMGRIGRSKTPFEYGVGPQNAPTPISPSPAGRESKPEARALRDLIEAVPTSAPEEGTGAIAGSVRSDDGQPVAGVLVTAVPSVLRPGKRASSPGGTGASDEDVYAVVREVVEQQRMTQLARRTASSDTVGAFELHGLAANTYALTASLEGYEVVSPTGQETQEALPGDDVTFIARAVVAIEAHVLLPDGTQPQSAKVKATRTLRRNRGSKAVDWSRLEPIILLSPGDYSLVAALGAEDPLVSDPVEISVRQGAERPSVTLQLAERPGIRGRVILPPGEELPTEVYVLRSDSSGPPDYAEVISKGKKQETDAEKGFRFLFRDLSPGRYMVAATRSEGRIEVFEVVEVESGLKTQDLHLNPLNASDAIEVWVLGPDGEPLPDVLFMDGCRPTSEQRARVQVAHLASSTTSARRRDGSYLVACFGSEICGYRERVAQRTLQIETALFGKKRVEYELPRAEPILVRFEERATLDVLVTGYKGSGHEGFVSVGMDPAGPPKKLDVDGRVQLGPFEPGEGQLYFKLDEGSVGGYGGTTAAATKVRLVPGASQVELALPRLQKLTLLVDKLSGDTSLSLDQLDEEGAPTGFRSAQKLVRDDGTVVFDRLTEGRYKVYSPNRRKGGEMLVTIPGEGVLRYEPRPKNTLFVKIEDAAGRLAQAGLRTGDRIIGIDGLVFEDEDFLDAQLKAAKLRDAVKLSVLRGTNALEVPYTFQINDTHKGDGGSLFITSR